MIMARCRIITKLYIKYILTSDKLSSLADLLIFSRFPKFVTENKTPSHRDVRLTVTVAVTTVKSYLP